MNRRAQHESDLHKPLLFQKVGIFIDAENIELSGLKHHGGRTDYRRILDKVGDREIIRILYYKPIYKEISSTFTTFWKGLGGEIKQPLKNADSFLIIDAVTLAEKMDVAIILGGDKDYLPLVWYLKSRGCRVEIWSWPEATSPDVKEAADVYFPLTVDFVVASEPPPAAAEGAASRTPPPRSAPPPPAKPSAGAKQPSTPKTPASAKAVAASAAAVSASAPRPVARSAKAAATSGDAEIEEGEAIDGFAPPELATESAAEAAPKKRRRGTRGGRRRRGAKKPPVDGGGEQEGSDPSTED
jgi:uncharacterized LabA/DUF88 family protein